VGDLNGCCPLEPTRTMMRSTAQAVCASSGADQMGRVATDTRKVGLWAS
jgi:hypothetical protein